MTATAPSPAAPSTPTLSTVRVAAQNNGLFKAAFTQGANGISTAQLTQLLQQVLAAAGIQLPTSVKVTLSGIQVVLAGGAFAEDIATGAEVLQCAGDLSQGLAGIAQILSLLGVIDPLSADLVGLGSNITVACESYGTNVLADLGCVLSSISVVGDLGALGKEASALAQSNARKSIQNYVRSKIVPQAQNAAVLVAQYTAGNLNLFDMIGQIALQDPTQFGTLFPGLACFLPQQTWGITTTALATSSGGFGIFHSTASDTETETFIQTIASKKQVQDAVVEKYLTIPMEPFESFETIAPVISIQAASVLALILQTGGSGDTILDFNFDVISAIQALGITPSVLGDDWLFKGLQRNEHDISDWETHFPYPPLTLPYVTPVSSGTVVNGVDVLTPEMTARNLQASELTKLQVLMQKYDQAGDIASLMQIPEAVAMLKRWSNFTVTPQFYTSGQALSDLSDYQNNLSQLQQIRAGLLGNSNDSATLTTVNAEIAALSKPSIPVGEIINMRLTGTSITTQRWYSTGMSTDPATPTGAQFWSFVYDNYSIDLSDYWRILSVLAQMQASQLFQDDNSVQGFQGSLTAIEVLFQSAYNFVIAKQLNLRARDQLAQALGIDPARLASRYDSQGNLIFYQKKAS